MPFWVDKVTEGALMNKLHEDYKEQTELSLELKHLYIKLNKKEILDLFDEKYNRLNSSNLIRFMNNPNWKSEFYYTPNNDYKSIKPDIEYIESYVLNLRFFIQDNEPISLNNFSKFYDAHCQDRESIEKFHELRCRLNKELDKSCSFLFNGKELTYRSIFEGYIYSKLAHGNTDKHVDFQRLIKTSLGKYMALDFFLRCIGSIQDILTEIYELNKFAFTDLD